MSLVATPLVTGTMSSRPHVHTREVEPWCADHTAERDTAPCVGHTWGRMGLRRHGGGVAADAALRTVPRSSTESRRL